MRYREKTLSQSLLSATFYSRGSCAASYTANETLWTAHADKWIYDCVTPGYHASVSRGGVLPYHPVEVVTRVYSAVPCNYTVTQNSPSCTVTYGDRFYADSFWNAFPSLPAVDGSLGSSLVNAACAEAKAKAFDALTFLAEFEKTTGMIASRIDKVFGLAQGYAHRASRERGLTRQVQVFSNLWLEGRYGWRPLLYDISNACRQLAEKPYFRCEGHNVATVDLAQTMATKVTDGSVSRVTCGGTRSGTRTYRGFALATGSFGTGPEFRPFQTVWELIPFSFVVDWFFDVGSWIRAVTPIPGVDLQVSGYSVKDEWTAVQTVVVTTKPGVTTHVSVTNTVGSYTTTAEQYNRFPLAPSLPSFNPRLNTLKLIDIVALVLQRVMPLRRFVRR